LSIGTIKLAWANDRYLQDPSVRLVPPSGRNRRLLVIPESRAERLLTPLKRLLAHRLPMATDPLRGRAFARTLALHDAHL
jgi:hypothetical protein